MDEDERVSSVAPLLGFDFEEGSAKAGVPGTECNDTGVMVVLVVEAVSASVVGCSRLAGISSCVVGLIIGGYMRSKEHTPRVITLERSLSSY